MWNVAIVRQMIHGLQARDHLSQERRGGMQSLDCLHRREQALMANSYTPGRTLAQHHRRCGRMG